MKHPLSFIYCLILTLCIQSTVAATRSFDNGAGNNDWFNSTNWLSNSTPAETDNLYVRLWAPVANSNVITDGGGSIALESTKGSTSVCRK
ncbi:MAG: hypothetical protein GXP22_02960 [Gammaproteobacteria bacterium]|nr:hypothetical protein [Gammaproteobacteria bacterium]